MPVIKVYHHGMTAAIPPKKNNHERAKRGIVQGWSKSAARNNTRWLRSVSPESFNGPDEVGIAFTLTLKNCPDSSDDWHSLRTSFVKRLRRMGMCRLHWVTEWQRRGVPHLHGVVYLPSGVDSPMQTVKRHWLELAGKYGALGKSQNLKLIDDVTGWFKYLSKHTARGADHYQRSSSGIPSGWIKTGRVWGHCGDWVTDDAVQIDASKEFYFALRRIVRKWRLADARTAFKEASVLRIYNETHCFGKDYFSSKRRIGSARRMLKCNDLKKSQVRGVSEWIDGNNVLLIAEYLISQGHEIVVPD